MYTMRYRSSSNLFLKKKFVRKSFPSEYSSWKVNDFIRNKKILGRYVKADSKIFLSLKIKIKIKIKIKYVIWINKLNMHEYDRLVLIVIRLNAEKVDYIFLMNE
jgi:hypothetical protein